MIHMLFASLRLCERALFSVYRTQALLIGALAFLALIATPVSSAQERVDIIIAESLEHCTVYDRYQQEMSSRDKYDRFVPFVPLVVEEFDATLGDGITPAARVRFDGDVYYLLKSGPRSVAGGGDVLKEYRDCTVFGDTVRVLKSGVLDMSVRGRSATSRTPLRAGDVAVRLFRRGEYYYLKLPGKRDRYGWCGLSPAGAWEVHVSGKRTAVALDHDRRGRIEARLAKANETYREFFAEFNRITGQSRGGPAWQVQEAEGEGIRCVLTGNEAAVSALAGSTRYLIRDIENVLIGTGLTVRYEEGAIVVGHP